MKKLSSRPFCGLLIALLALGIGMPQSLFAEGNSVTAAELRDAVRQRSSERDKNLAQVRSFFADPKVSKILNDAHLNTGRIEKAVAALDAGDLAKLAARTADVQKDFAAGALSNQELTYVVIAIGAAVLVLIIVAA